ncbi:hypothetical protein ACP4OV_010428 [Aristida adscensionis]
MDRRQADLAGAVRIRTAAPSQPESSDAHALDSALGTSAQLPPRERCGTPRGGRRGASADGSPAFVGRRRPGPNPDVACIQPGRQVAQCALWQRRHSARRSCLRRAASAIRQREPFSLLEVPPVHPRQVASLVKNTLHSAVDLLQSFVATGALGSVTSPLERRLLCPERGRARAHPRRPQRG